MTRVDFFCFADYFLCRRCGHEVVSIADVINIPSKLAMRQRNDTFGPKQGVLIQLFKNPQGMILVFGLFEFIL